jgi:hypothetical protein
MHTGMISHHLPYCRAQRNDPGCISRERLQIFLLISRGFTTYQEGFGDGKRKDFDLLR